MNKLNLCIWGDCISVNQGGTDVLIIKIDGSSDKKDCDVITWDNRTASIQDLTKKNKKGESLLFLKNNRYGPGTLYLHNPFKQLKSQFYRHTLSLNEKYEKVKSKLI